MDDLISREAALAAISDDKGIQYPGWWYKDRIRTAPGVDAVEIVRCRDCKWFQKNVMDNGLPPGINEYECGYWDGSCEQDDFCSRAKKREA